MESLLGLALFACATARYGGGADCAMSTTDFCALACKNSTLQNSGCDCAIGNVCTGDYYHLRPTPAERDEIQRHHNDYRNRVASGHVKELNVAGATNMHLMGYDIDLELLADCWTKKCILDHDRCRATDKFHLVGQNMYKTRGLQCPDNQVFFRAIDAWFDEVEKMTTTCVKSWGACVLAENFAQLIWAKTTYVGCSRVEVGALECHVFCDYGVAGNVVGEPVFAIGPPAKHCNGTAVAMKFDKLCMETSFQLRSEAGRASPWCWWWCAVLLTSGRMYLTGRRTP